MHSLQCYQRAIEYAVPLLWTTGLLVFLPRYAAGEHRDCENYPHITDLVHKHAVHTLTKDESVDDLVDAAGGLLHKCNEEQV